MNVMSKKNQKISDNNKRTWKNTNIRNKRIDGIVKYTWGNIDQSVYFNLKIKPLIWSGMTLIQMYKSGKIDKSAPTIRKILYLYGTQDDIQKSKENISYAKGATGRGKKGKTSPLKGRTYEDILGSKERAIIRSKITSKWMQTKNIRRFTTRISKPQRMLYDIIKKRYDTAVLEYTVQTQTRTLHLDIAVPELKLNFEYDGLHWHKNNKKEKYSDTVRDEELVKLGWKVYRIGFWENPTLEQLETKVKEIQL